MKWYFVKLHGKSFPMPWFAGDGSIATTLNKAKFVQTVADAVAMRNAIGDLIPKPEIWCIDLEKNKLTKVKV